MFEWEFDLKINMNKIKLHYLGPNASIANRLANILGCRVDILPFHYLGLPLHIRSLRMEDWASIVNSIKERIEGVEGKTPLTGGETYLGQLGVFEHDIILLYHLQSATMGSEMH